MNSLKENGLSLASLILEDQEMHRCMPGKMVKMSSLKCQKDLEKRIEDAASHRDGSGSRTDARLHYNGLLRILRRKLRQAIKSHGV